MTCVIPLPPLLTQIKYLLKLLWMKGVVKLYLFLRRLFRYGYYKHKPDFTHKVSTRRLPSYLSPNKIEVYLPSSKPFPASTAPSSPVSPPSPISAPASSSQMFSSFPFAYPTPPSTPVSSPKSESGPRFPSTLKKLPLLMTVHGGGFALGDPILDSQFNRYISNTASCIVVALPYRKAPYFQWPVQVNDLTALVDEVLRDPRIKDLYDPSKVALAGFSAGGNLATVLSIQPQLKGKIQTIVPIYPVLDWTVTPQDKLAIRTPGPPDVLETMGDVYVYGYIPDGQDREDVTLSPIYADHKDIPENVYLVSCEYDMLNIDCVAFYNKFKRFKKNMVYEQVKGVVHGFTHQGASRIVKAENEKMDKITFELYDRIAVWLDKIWGQKKKTVKWPELERAGGIGDEIVVL